MLEYVILNYLLKRFGKQIKGQAREKDNSRHLLKRKRRVALNLVGTRDDILLNATHSIVTSNQIKGVKINGIKKRISPVLILLAEKVEMKTSLRRSKAYGCEQVIKGPKPRILFFSGTNGLLKWFPNLRFAS